LVFESRCHWPAPGAAALPRPIALRQRDVWPLPPLAAVARAWWCPSWGGPQLVRVDQLAISDAGPDAAYSAPVTVFATLEIDEAMRIEAMRGHMVL